MSRTYYDAEGYPINLDATQAWVSPGGIGICARCVFDALFSRIGWNARWRPSRIFTEFGYERCNDEWCSICDRNI